MERKALTEATASALKAEYIDAKNAEAMAVAIIRRVGLSFVTQFRAERWDPCIGSRRTRQSATGCPPGWPAIASSSMS